LGGGLGLRLDWEDDKNWMSHNPNTQTATAIAEIVVLRDTFMTVAWSGMGETQDPNYELMSLYVDGNLVGSAHATGHLFEAEDESQQWLELHTTIRQARKSYQADGTMPDWDMLDAMIGELRNGIQQDSIGHPA